MTHLGRSGTLAALLLMLEIFTVQAADKLTDPQIAHIVYTVGVIDIKNAELALLLSKDKNVRAFAQDMVRKHKAVNDQALALVKKLGVTPEDNATSKALTKQAEDERAALKLVGPGFDKAYAEKEVAYYKTVNGALQTALIPEANNAELKDFLSTGLKIFQGHQLHAEHMVAELNRGNPIIALKP